MNGASHGRRHRFPRRGRRPSAARLALGLACLAVVCLAAALAAYGGTTPAPPSAAAHPTGHRRTHLLPVSAVVSVARDASRTAVPRSYLGLSTEYWALPLWAGQMPLLERAMSLVRVRGGGPLILRVGGDSADHAFWDPNAGAGGGVGGIRVPSWAFSLAPKWLGQARALVRRLGLRLIVDLNLITDTPSAAAQWAHAAQAGLPPHSIDAFEVGNEPDIYSRVDWLAITADRGLTGRLPGRQLGGAALPAALTARDYVRDFHAYASTLGQVDRQAALAGPALANPVRHGRWVQTLIDGARRDLGLVTIHRYPYTGCPHRRGTPSYATLARVLSPAASTGMALALRPLVDAAHDASLPLRLTELNSVNCGGRAGVSDAFATALWAPDALFALLRAGVDGVNLHVRAAAVNAPFALGPAGLQARPLLYGLILFARTLGPDAQLVTLRSRLSRPANLAAWAVRVGSDTLHVLLIDKSRRAERVSLRLPATGLAEVQRLVAPAAAARSGITLGGRALAADGRWEGPPTHQALARRGDAYAVNVPSMSAALITVRVRRGALGVAGAPGRGY